MPDQPRTSRRNPQMLDAYVQVAIDASIPSTPSAATKSRRRRKKKHEEASNPLLLTIAAVPPTLPAPAKPKRPRRTTKSKNTILNSGKTLQRCKFCVRGLVTAEELEDEDEAEDVQEEVRADFERFGEIQQIVIVKGEQVDNQVGDVVIAFQNSENAAPAFDAYDKKMFGGKTVAYTWKTRNDGENFEVVVNGMLAPDELEDPDEVADIEEEVMQIFTKYGEVKNLRLNESTGEITVSFSEECDAEKAMQVMNGSRYGGRDVTANLKHSSGKTHSDDENAASQGELEAKCVAIPIIQPTEATGLQNLVGLFLKRLAALQERAYAKNKANKRSRRLVLGMHETRRGLLCNKIVLLIIATDLDGCEAVEEKYRELVAMANEHEVPILALVNRRKLGRMLQKSVRVSCVGVYSVEGANDLYQQILQRMNQQ